MDRNYFHEVIDRKSTYARKWDALGEVFGAEDVLPMWVADMDFPSPPAVVEAIQARAAHGVYGYPHRTSSYYQSVTEWLDRRHNWSVDSRWITNTPAVVTAISVAIQTFTQPGDQVIIQPPVYPPFFGCVKKNGREVVENPLINSDGYYTMDFEDLERKLNPRVKMFILCSPHNPVGRVWTADELRKLGEILARHNIVVLVDEMHADLVFAGHSFIPFTSVNEAIKQKSLTFISPAKTFNIAGFFNSITITPNPELRNTFHDALDRLELLAGNLFGIVAFEAAYRSGAMWADNLLWYLEENAAYMTDFIKTRMPQLRVTKPEGTYLAWIDCRELGMQSAQLRDFFIKEAKVGVNDGYTFGAQGEGFIRLNFGCPRATLQEGLERIENAINTL